GAVLVTPLREGAVFCVLGDAGGFQHDFTRLKEHSFKDTGGLGWVSQSWDHWPIGWINSQGHEVTSDSLPKFPNHFSPSGMDFFASPNDQVERRIFYPLLGVASGHRDRVPAMARHWLSFGPPDIADLKKVAALAPTFSHSKAKTTATSNKSFN